jgi:tetratricopeptide (TPR) repeat protein
MNEPNFIKIQNIRKNYEECLDNLLILNENDPVIIWEAILFYSEKNNELIFVNYESYKKALTLCNTILEIKPEINTTLKCMVLEKMITIHMKTEFSTEKDIQLAKKLSKELLKITNGNDRSLYIRGSIYYRELNFNKCLEYYEKAIEKNNKNELFQLEYKNVLLKLDEEKNMLKLVGKDVDVLKNKNFQLQWGSICKKYNLKENTNINKKLIKN